MAACPKCGIEMRDVVMRVPLFHFPGCSPKTAKKVSATKPIYRCDGCKKYYQLALRLVECHPIK